MTKLQSNYEVVSKHIRGLPSSKRKVVKKSQEFDSKIKKYPPLTRMLSHLNHTINDHHKYLQENL